MNKLEAVKDYKYDVNIFFDEDNCWHWEVLGGYPSVMSSKLFTDIKECEEDLDRFLEKHEGFNK